jgi:hypothetical protein
MMRVMSSVVPNISQDSTGHNASVTEYSRAADDKIARFVRVDDPTNVLGQSICIPWHYIELHMPKSQVSRFNCPNCDALYMLVQVPAAPLLLYRQITCRSCDGPLEAQKGRFILKYFLLEERHKGPAEAKRRKYVG